MFLGLGTPACVRACVCPSRTNFTAVLSKCTHFNAKYTQKPHFTLIYDFKESVYGIVVFRWCVLVRLSTVSWSSQQWYMFWYKQMSLVMHFVLLLTYRSTRLEFTKFALGPTGCGL